jgi:hypothetical protein
MSPARRAGSPRTFRRRRSALWLVAVRSSAATCSGSPRRLTLFIGGRTVAKKKAAKKATKKTAKKKKKK